jgi:hypothetical protein
LSFESTEIRTKEATVNWKKRFPGIPSLGLILATLPLLALSILGPEACRSYKTFLVESLPPVQPVIVDGRSDDWSGNLYLLDDERISIGFLNDRENLYICLLAEDNALRTRMMQSGLTVWFDPTGGKKKALGIRILAGPHPGGGPMPKPEEDTREMDASEDEPPGGPRSEIEIIDPESGGIRKFDPEDAGGIEIKAVPSSGLYVYELKIPFVRSDEFPIAVGASPGSTIGVGFETEKTDSGKRPGPGDGGMGEGGGRPPMGGGMPGGRGMPDGGRMGGMRGGREPQMSRGLKIWVLVRTVAGIGPQRAEAMAFLD